MACPNYKKQKQTNKKNKDSSCFQNIFFQSYEHPGLGEIFKADIKFLYLLTS